ncbi:MAG: mechanosensitive ion channel family protein [Deinococcaceae bacterium]
MDIWMTLQSALTEPQTLFSVVLALGIVAGVWRLGCAFLEQLLRVSLSPTLERTLRRIWHVVSAYLALIVTVKALGLTQLSYLYPSGNAVVFWFNATIGRTLAVVALSYLALLLIENLSQRVVVSSDEFNRRNVRATTLRDIVRSTLRVSVFTVAGIEVLQNLGINATTLLAGVSVLGLAISFGAQSLIKDLLTGFFILLEDQYGVGDVITINSGSLSGSVEKLTLRVTQLRALDGTVHVVPNGQILTVSVSSKDWSRFVANLIVTLDTDLDMALLTLERVAQELYADDRWHPLFLEAPTVDGVTQFLPDGIQLRALFKVFPKEQYALGREFNRRIKEAFDRAGISLYRRA